MGCTQSKLSNNSRRNRERRRKSERSSTSATTVNQEISSQVGALEEANSQAEIHDLREIQIPGEKYFIKNQTTVNDEHPVTELQTVIEQTGTKNDKGVTEPEHVSRPRQISDRNVGLSNSGTPTNPEIDVTPEVLSKMQGNTHSAHEDSNPEKHNIAPPPAAAAPSSSIVENISTAKKSSVYRPSFPRSEAEVPANYVDETNMKTLEYEELAPEIQSSSLTKYQVLRKCESDLLGSERSWTAQMSKTESSRNQYQYKLKDPGVRAGRPEVDLSRLPDSNEFAPQDIGNICIDARTGEFKFYQRGVLIGYVDKEEALRLSNDWPICPGTNDSISQMERHTNPREEASNTMNDFSITSSRSQDLSYHQIRREQYSENKLIDEHLKSDTTFSDQPLRGQVDQSIPRHRGYYM